MDHTNRLRARPLVEALEERWQPSAPTMPTYAATFADAVTADNSFLGADGKQYWTVDAGADRYQDDNYERPTAQTYQVVQAADGTMQFAASEYFANLDIVEGKAGFDDTYLYVSIKMAGLTEEKSGSVDTKGLIYQYGFRLAKTDDGGGGLLVVADQPGLKNSGKFGGQSTFVYRDANGDVGGTGQSVTKQDRQAEVNGNGYERVLASDGRASNGQQILWVRISPTDPTVVEFALNYKAVGYTAADLQNLPFLTFQANKGLQDPGNYAWNDEYTKSEAGSPYRATSGNLSKSEFGTQGLGNIYELDTLRGGKIVAPGEGSLSGFVFVDANRNGVRDDDEPGLSGVEITLSWIDAQGQPQEKFAFTDANGFYQFNELEPGEYTIQEDQPQFYEDGEDSIGSLDGNAEINDLFSVITLPPGGSGINYNFGELFGE